MFLPCRLHDTPTSVAYVLDSTVHCRGGPSIGAHINQRMAAILANYRPLRIVGDGNCCYWAAAVGIYGEEGLHQCVRLRTAIEMVQNRPH